MAAAAIFDLGKMSITLDWIKISCNKLYRKMHHGHAEMTTDKSRNRKLIRVTSSNERLYHTCVDLSDYNRYLNHIWYRTQIYRTINTPEWPNSHKPKIQDGGGRHLAAILNFGKMSITLDWINIFCIKLYVKMHHGHAEMTT